MDKKIEQTIMEHVDDVVKHSSDCLRHDIAEIVSKAVEKERERIYKMIPVDCRGHIGEAEMRKAGIDVDKYA